MFQTSAVLSFHPSALTDACCYQLLLAAISVHPKFSTSFPRLRQLPLRQEPSSNAESNGGGGPYVQNGWLPSKVR